MRIGKPSSVKLRRVRCEAERLERLAVHKGRTDPVSRNEPESPAEETCPVSVMVFGASGQIGHFLLSRLVARGETVQALSRSAHADAPGVHWLRGSLPSPPALARDVPSLSALINLGPLPEFAQWLQCASLHGQPRVIAMSSMSAQSKRESPDPSERAMISTLLNAEQRLIAACEQRGMRWTLLRSTLIYGAGTDKSLAPIARAAMRWHAFPLPQGRGLRQPVHADDLALAILAILDRPLSGDRIIAIGGGERLAAQAMFARVRAGLPVWTLPVPIPRFVMALLTRLLPRRAAMIRRLDADLIVDNADAVHVLAVHPRAFEPRF